MEQNPEHQDFEALGDSVRRLVSRSESLGLRALPEAHLLVMHGTPMILAEFEIDYRIALSAAVQEPRDEALSLADMEESLTEMQFEDLRRSRLGE